MEKSFRSLRNKISRDAYVEAELINALSHQIRILRQQRGWSQKDLAVKLGTTQTTISRIEDPSYGKISISTLLKLAKVFDVALYLRFMQFSDFMHATWDTSEDRFKAHSYHDEAKGIRFYEEFDFSKTTSVNLIQKSSQDYLLMNVEGQAQVQNIEVIDSSSHFIDGSFLFN